MLIIGEILKQSLPAGWLLYDPSIVLDYASDFVICGLFQTVGSRSALWQPPSFAGQPIKGEWSKGIDGLEVI